MTVRCNVSRCDSIASPTVVEMTIVAVTAPQVPRVQTEETRCNSSAKTENGDA